MKQHTIFYGSSYDRGLQHLLGMWDQIKEAFPDAELHICYGWDLYVDFYKDNPTNMAWKDRMDKLMDKPGIIHHGRVGKEELHKIRLKCGIWAYPTHFTEINCITALEAQNDGCVPVVMNLAALQETVQSGKKVDGDIYDDEAKEMYYTALHSMMQWPKQWKEEKERGKKFAENYDWRKIALQWKELME